MYEPDHIWADSHDGWGGKNPHNLIKFNLEKKTAYDKKKRLWGLIFGKAVKEAWNFSVGE